MTVGEAERKRAEYVYDERYRIAGDVSIRPDFYLPEFDLYIEYWGMQEQDYLARKSEKKFDVAGARRTYSRSASVRPSHANINQHASVYPPTLASSRHSSSVHRTTTFSFSPTPRPPPTPHPTLASSRLDSRRHRIALGEGLRVSRTNGRGAVVSPTSWRFPIF